MDDTATLALALLGVALGSAAAGLGIALFCILFAMFYGG